MAPVPGTGGVSPRTLVAVACLVLVVGGAVGQEDADTTTEAPDQDSAFIRVAHVSPDAPPVAPPAPIVVTGPSLMDGLCHGSPLTVVEKSDMVTPSLPAHVGADGRREPLDLAVGLLGGHLKERVRRLRVVPVRVGPTDLIRCLDSSG